MKHIHRTYVTLFALVTGLVGLTVGSSAAYAMTDPQGPGSQGPAGYAPTVSSDTASSASDVWQMILAGAAAAATAVLLTLLVQHIVATHHSRASIAKA